MNQGLYFASIAGAGTSQTKKGGMQVWIDLDVTHVDVNGAWVQLASPVQATTFLSLSDSAMKYTREKLNKLGFNGQFGDMRFSSPSTEIELRHEMYDGKQREKWELPGDYQREALPIDKIRTLDALWKQGAKPAATPPPPGRPSSAPPQRPVVQQAVPADDHDPLLKF